MDGWGVLFESKPSDGCGDEEYCPDSDCDVCSVFEGCPSFWSGGVSLVVGSVEDLCEFDCSDCVGHYPDEDYC